MKRIDWLIAGCREEWEKLLDHPFPRELGAGTLPFDSFLYYLAQDTWYLEDFLRTVGLLVAKAEQAEIRRFGIYLLQETVSGELAMHEKIERDYERLSAVPVGKTAAAYGNFLVREAYQGDDVGILTALAPCVVSYRLIAETLNPDSEGGLPDPYRFWIETYRSEEYGELVERFLDCLQLLPAGQWEDRKTGLSRIFAQACAFEYSFWEECYGKTSV